MPRDDSKEAEKRNYHCLYCGNKFVSTAKRYGVFNKGIQRNTQSNQIKCPKCGNFLKTWED